MNKAAIDIGSNSVQFLIVDNTGKQLFREQYVTGLGRGVSKDGNFDEESMKDTLEALKSCLDACQIYSVDQSRIRATATEASRKAKNSAEFYKKVLNNFSLPVKIISGEEEAHLSTLGVVMSGSELGADTIIDIGGASTEITLFKTEPFEILKTISLPLGSVRLKVLKDEKGISANQFLKDFNLAPYKTNKILGISGTMTSITAMKLGLKEFDENKVDGVILSLNDVKEIALKLSHMSVEEILDQFPFIGKRAGIVAYGTSIMATLMDILETEEVITSTKGLVHGSVLAIKE